MIQKRLRPRQDPQKVLRRLDTLVTWLGGRPVQGGVKDAVHYGEYRCLGISFRVLIRDSRVGKPAPMTIVEVPHKRLVDDPMTTATLLSQDHRFICQAPVPAHVKQPEVIVWAPRVFVRIGDRRYREVFSYTVTHPVDFQPPGASAKAKT